jgi:hypothetical protein
MEQLLCQNMPVIAADLPVHEHTKIFMPCKGFLFSGDEQGHSSLQSRCNEGENESFELPPPHKFVRHSDQTPRFRTGFNSRKQALHGSLPYLTYYRQVQGQLLAADAAKSRRINQAEMLKLADEIVRTYRVPIN